MFQAIILAGGLGTRLRSVVSDLPKPMAPINGRPFLEYQLDYWIKQGIEYFIISVGYRYEAIIDHFRDSYNGAKINYVIEESPLGTGGGLLLAAQNIEKNESFLLLNGDTYFAVDLMKLIEFSTRNDADCCFSLFRTRESGRYMSVNVLPDGEIAGLSAEASSPEFLANGGVYWMSSIVFKDLFSAGVKTSLEADIFPAAMAAGKHLYGVEFGGTFIDIGVPDDYKRASDLLIL